MFISGIYLYPCEIKFLSDLRKVGGTPVSFVSKAHHHESGVKHYNQTQHLQTCLPLCRIITAFFYSHQPNTYSYREVNSYIQHIKFCSCVKNYNYTKKEVRVSY